ncbi:MAG: hemolysin family protein [Firmicutes bacterium]|nr:hemolysin family protein [Bacillota bacterium]
MSFFNFAFILILLIINAVYVAAEFAVVGVRKSQVRQIAQRGISSAVSLVNVIDNPALMDRYIAACQAGITLSSLVLGAYGQATITPVLVPVFIKMTNAGQLAALSACSVIVLIILTMLQVVIGELVPKYLALQFPVRIALYTVMPVKVSLKVFSLLIDLLNGTGNLVLKMFGLSSVRHGHIHSPEEIDMLIAESRDGGILEPDEQERLHKALQLAGRTAHYLMVPRTKLQTIDINTPVEEIPRIVADSPFTRIPVYEGSIDNITGILHTKEVVSEIIRSRELNLRKLIKPVLKVPRNMKGDNILSYLRKNRGHQALVIDEYGGVEGLVTLDDLLGEMLGDIGDELKENALRPVRISENTVKLPGIMNADDAEPWLGTIISGQSQSIGGIVIDTLGHIPREGEKTEVGGIQFTVEKMSGNAIKSLIAKLPEQKEASFDG